MSTVAKFYLHDAATNNTGTLPGASTLDASSPTVTATGASTNRDATGSLGATQTSIAVATNATTSAQSAWHRRFLSYPIAAQTIAAQTITFSMACEENNASANYLPTCGVYLWRPSTGTKIGTLLAVGSISLTEPSTVQIARSGTATSTSVTALDGDILVFETWRKSNAQGAATTYTDTEYYDGTTEASASSCASFVGFATPIAIYSPPVTGYAAAVVADNPISYWRHGDASSPSRDQMGASNAKAAGGVTYGQTGALTGDANKAVLLDGSTGYLYAANVTGYSLAATGVLSFEICLNYTSTGVSQAFFSHGTGVGGYDYLIYVDGTADKLACQFWDSGGTNRYQVASTATLSSGYHHIVITVAPTVPAVKYYVDGSLIQTETTAWVGTSTASTAQLALGRKDHTADTWFNGGFDEQAIYGTILTQSRVSAHYAAGRAIAVKVRRSSAWTAGAVKVRRTGAWVAPTAVKVRRGGAWTTVT